VSVKSLFRWFCPCCPRLVLFLFLEGSFVLVKESCVAIVSVDPPIVAGIEVSVAATFEDNGEALIFWPLLYCAVRFSNKDWRSSAQCLALFQPFAITERLRMESSISLRCVSAHIPKCEDSTYLCALLNGYRFNVQAKAKTNPAIHVAESIPGQDTIKPRSC